MLEIIGRSHRGRICEFKKGEGVVRTPLILSTIEKSTEAPIRIKVDETNRYLSVMGSEIPIDSTLLTTASSQINSVSECIDGVCVIRLPVTGEEKIPDEAEIIVIPNSFELRRNPRKLVEYIIKIRELVGYNRLVCMLGIGEPSMLSLLAYMGVDIFDDSLVRSAGFRGLSLIPEGEIYTGKDESESNIEELERECNKVRDFISAERLRELVDQRAVSSPSAVATLRIFDREGYAYQEEACSVTGEKFSCNAPQSLKRPDISRYKEKILERYKKPEHKRILLLLPCSAKKPYHISRTHKAFASAIHTAPHETLIHEVIVTSPLGIVPRELDVLYPASSYDIPVTGEWNCEEKNMIRDMVSHIISQGYDKVICHLGEDIELVKGLAEMEETVVGDSTSSTSLKNLDMALRNATKDMEPIDYYIERRENVRSLLMFQFGQEVADGIMNENAYAIGKFPYWKIMQEDADNKADKKQLGMLTPERGMVSLTLDGAEILAEKKMFTVEMMDFEMKGNLFSVGVIDADPNIRIGDEAVIMLNGKLKGVGVSMMSGREMVELKRGIAVKVRHKVK